MLRVPVFSVATSCAVHDWSGQEKHISINKFGGLSQDWVGGRNLLCVFGVMPYGG